MTFGKLLKSLRAKKGIGIKKMAPELGMNYTYLSKLENSKVAPSQKLINKLSIYFNYSQEELTLIAGKIPPDVQQILKNNPKEAVEYLRRKFGSGNTKST